MKRTFLCTSLFVSFFWLIAAVFGREAARDVLKGAPDARGDIYRCVNMIRTVNYLRGLGKDAALKVLRKDLKESGFDDNDKILLICRLLFVNPKGWSPIALGEPDPEVDATAIKQFPLFPLDVVEGVPFFLVRGYKQQGLSEFATLCLDKCVNFSIIPADLSNVHYEKAARSLFNGERFKSLYRDPNVYEEMSSMIFRQAFESQ